MLFWQDRREEVQSLADKAWPERAQSVRQIAQTFGLADTFRALREELTTEIGDYVNSTGLPFSSHEAAMSAKYLSLELAKPKIEFEISHNARDLADRLLAQLRQIEQQELFTAALERLRGDIGKRWHLVSTLLTAEQKRA